MVEEEAVGQPLNRALFQKGETALVQRLGDLPQLPLLEEAEADERPASGGAYTEG